MYKITKENRVELSFSVSFVVDVAVSLLAVATLCHSCFVHCTHYLLLDKLFFSVSPMTCAFAMSVRRIVDVVHIFKFNTRSTTLTIKSNYNCHSLEIVMHVRMSVCVYVCLYLWLVRAYQFTGR